MSKIEKKRAKLQSRIDELEKHIATSLGKKDSKTDEISVPKLMSEIADLKKTMAAL